MSQIPELPDLPDPDELQDRLSRTVAILMVGATLGAAVVGYLVASTSRGDDLADITAQRHAVRANGRSLRSQQRAQVDHQAFVLAAQQRRRASIASLEELFVSGQEAKRYDLEEQRWIRVAKRTQELTTITEKGPDGPERDPAFPARFFARSAEAPSRLAALQDAANQESSIWEAKVAQHTAVLTLFAVALYLFGLSFTMQPRPRRLFAVVGTAMLAVGATWALVAVLTPPTRAPEEAADAFARGSVSLRTAASPADYQRARAQFTEAIRLRPDFPRAYVLRAEATFQAGSSQRSGYASLTRPENLRAAIADLRRARELRTETLTVLASLGFYTFVEGVNEKDADLLEESIAFTNEARALDPRDPVLHFNLGVSLLASGRTEEARAAYTEGVRHLLYTDPAKKTLRSNPGLEEQWVAGALTDLELLLGSGRRDLAKEIRRTKEYLIASASLGRPGGPQEAPAASVVEVDVFPGELQWRANFDELDTESDVVSAQWFARDAELEAWAGLPEPSGTINPGFDEDLAQHFDLRTYLAATLPPRCLPDGRYRVELYVNGRLAGSAEEDASFGNLEAFVDRDLAVGFCRPSDWVDYAAGLPGLFSGQISPDGSSGAYVFNLPLPSQFKDDPPEVRAEVFLDFVVQDFADLFPSKPKFLERDAGTFFMGLDGATIKRYEYEGGQVLAGAGVDDLGAVVVGAVFGTAEELDDGTAFQVYNSLVRLE